MFKIGDLGICLMIVHKVCLKMMQEEIDNANTGSFTTVNQNWIQSSSFFNNNFKNFD